MLALTLVVCTFASCNIYYIEHNPAWQTQSITTQGEAITLKECEALKAKHEYRIDTQGIPKYMASYRIPLQVNTKQFEGMTVELVCQPLPNLKMPFNRK